VLTAVYEVEGMNCVNCANAVRKAISALPGVAEAVVDLGARKATVSGGDLPDAETLVQAVAAAGFTLHA
jgi:copper chaperone CopZ